MLATEFTHIITSVAPGGIQDTTDSSLLPSLSCAHSQFSAKLLSPSVSGRRGSSHQSPQTEIKARNRNHCFPEWPAQIKFSAWEESVRALQDSCLENSMDRGAWWATVHGVTKSQTQLSVMPQFSSASDWFLGLLLSLMAL